MTNVSNLEKYKQDLSKLITEGEKLSLSIQYECFPKEFEKQVKSAYGEKEFIKIKKDLKDFKMSYQFWYSESVFLIKQLLPDRLKDFIKLYEKPSKRKSIDYENYVVEDYLQGLTRTMVYDRQKIVGPDAAVPKFVQQVNILKSVSKRFESSLFDILLLVRADLFDSELDAAKNLNKNGFVRGSGAMAGVVLEEHLSLVCSNHGIIMKKKDPTISDYNDELKKIDVLDLPKWRFIQHLADIRNKCDHKKNTEPSKEEVFELIEGIEKIIKTLF